MAYSDETTRVGEESTETLATPQRPLGATPGNGFGTPESGSSAERVKGTARDEASAVKETVAGAGANVVDTAKGQGAQVVDEARHQGRRLLDEGVSELRTQAGSAQERLAGFLRSASDELHTMTSQGDHAGPVADLVREVERYGSRAAQWLESSSPDDLVSSVRRYAARNPWQFLAISAGAGFVAARLFRGLQAGDDQVGRGDVRPLTGSTEYTSAGTTGPIGAPGYADTGLDPAPITPRPDGNQEWRR